MPTTTFACRLPILLGASLLPALPAHALSLHRTRTVSAEFVIGGTVSGAPASMSVGSVALQPPPGPPAPDDYLRATVTPPANRVWPGSADAQYVTEGFTVIEIEGRRTDSTGTEPYELRAVIEEQTYGFNEFAGNPRPLAFSLRLIDMAIELSHLGNAWDSRNPFFEPSDAVGAMIWYEVLLDGALRYRGGSTLYFNNSATMRGDRVPDAIFDATNIAGDVIWSDVLNVDEFGGAPGSTTQTASYFDKNIPELYLGDILPLKDFTVTARLGATLVMPPFAMDAGGRITVGDPNGLRLGDLGTPRLGEPVTTPVPLPAAGWLLAGALATLAMAGRRRARA